MPNIQRMIQKIPEHSNHILLHITSNDHFKDQEETQQNICDKINVD